MLRALLVLALLAAAGGGYLVYRTSTEQARELEAERERVRERDAAIGRLTRSRRVAQAVVKDQWRGEDGVLRTRVRFVELDDEGQPVVDRLLEAEGDEVYFDALVLKFDEARVAAGEALRGKSVLMFRRLFGSAQKPDEGAPIDPAAAGADGVPAVYRARGGTTPADAELWREFWRYANEPEAAARDGVRVAQGEAPFLRLEKGKVYDLVLDDDGGLNVVASRVPPVLLER